jgi:predicted membrane protein
MKEIFKYVGVSLLIVGALVSLGDREAKVKKMPKRNAAVTAADQVKSHKIMSNVTLKTLSQQFSGGEVYGMMSETNVDLSQAGLAPESAIDLGVLMGSVKITVPADWTVISDVNAFMGSYKDFKDKTKVTDESKVLNLYGTAVMGSVEVHRI